MRRLVSAALITIFALAAVGAFAASVDETWIRFYNPVLNKYQTPTKGSLYPCTTFSWNNNRGAVVTTARLDAAGIDDTRMYWCDDFMEAAAVLASTVYSNAHWTKSNGAGAGTATITAGRNGTMVLDSLKAAQNDDVVLTFTTANFAIAGNPSIQTLVMPNNLTNCVFEAGWYVDANDEILFRFNPAVDATHWQIYYENNNGGEQVFDTNVAASTSAYQRLRIDVFSTGGAKCYIDGVLVRTYATSTVRNVAFKPRFYAKVTDAGHAAIKTLTIDYVKLWQDR